MCFWISMHRQSLLFLLLNVLYIQMMKKSSLMRAGHYRIFQMAPMIKSKLLLTQVSAPDSLNYYCEYWTLFKCWIFFQFLELEPSFIFSYRFVMLWKFFLLSHPSPTVLIPALRTVGNIVTGDDMQTQVCTTKVFHPLGNMVSLGFWKCHSLHPEQVLNKSTFSFSA